MKSLKEFANDLRTGKATSAFSAVFIICNSCLGSATLAIPYTFHQAGGIYASMAVMVISGFLLAATLVIYGYVQGYSTKKLESMGDFAGEFVGPKFAQITQLLVFCQILGTCASYILIIKDQVHLLIQQIVSEEYYEDHWFVDSRIITIYVTVIAIFPICLKRDLDFLKYPSYLVILGIFFVVFDVFIRYLTGDFHPVTVDKPDPIYKVLNAFPVILLGYACHFNAAPVYANMENRTLTNWTKVSVISTICCFMCYSLIGIGGYLSFGEDVKSDIIQSLPDSVDATVARAMITIAVTFSYPCVYTAGRSIINSWINIIVDCCKPRRAQSRPSKLSLLKNEDDRSVEICGIAFGHDIFLNFVITIIWLLVTSAIGLLAESLDIIVNFTGSFTAHFFLIVPGIILAQTSFRHAVNTGNNSSKIKIQSNSYRIFKIVFGVLTTAIGVFVFSHGFTSAVIALLPDEG